jgi:hypothetical protein
VTIFGHGFANDKLPNERRTKIILENNMINDVIVLLIVSGIYRYFSFKVSLM